MGEAFASSEAHLDHCVKYGNDADKLHAYNLLFVLHKHNKDFERAQTALGKCITLGRKVKHYTIVGGAYSDYSHVRMVEGKCVDAVEMAKIGFKPAKLQEPAIPILEYRVRLNIAKAYIELEEYEVAKALLDEMINEPVLDTFIREKADCYQLQGQWYAKQHDYKEAFDAYTIAKELVESDNDLGILRDIQENRCTLCELMNDIHLGYTVQKEYIALLKEINERELALTALKLDVKHNLSAVEKRASTDYLTGLYNRSYMEETTDAWLEKAAAANENIICIAFDIDNLKPVNDQYGHLAGDELIKRVGDECSKILQEDVLMGRFGGDEFAIIVKEASLEYGKQLAEQVAETIRSIQIEEDGTAISATASIGISDRASSNAQNFKELFNAADRALYEAKQNGKNRICVMC